MTKSQLMTKTTNWVDLYHTRQQLVLHIFVS